MANKTIFQLPASGALVSTDELEKQLTAAGASQKLTLAQLLTFIQNNATAFAQNPVAFAGGATFAAGNDTITADGQLVFRPGGVFARTLVLALDGSFSTMNGGFIFNSDGTANFAGGAIGTGADGSAAFASGAFTVAADGQITVGAMANTIFPADGSATLAGGVVLVSATGDIEITDTTKGYITKSPNGTRYRIKVDDAGNLGTEAA